MAAPALPDLATAEGRQEAIAKLDPDFHGLMERHCRDAAGHTVKCWCQKH